MDNKGFTVLLVEDDDDSRKLLGTMLKQNGAEVTSAASAADAFLLFSEKLHDVLVSDIGMPGEDGFDLISRVRALGPERGGNIPAIALTSYARAEDRARVLGAGFQRYISKPVEPSSLAMAVASLARRTAKA